MRKTSASSGEKGVIPTRVWILLCIAVFALLLICTVCLHRPVEGRRIAHVLTDGTEILSVDLDAVDDAVDFEIEAEGYPYTLRAEHGRICVAEASCPDKVCVRMGWLQDSSYPIVCLPRRLVVQIERGFETEGPWGELDGVSG